MRDDGAATFDPASGGRQMPSELSHDSNRVGSGPGSAGITSLAEGVLADLGIDRDTAAAARLAAGRNRTDVGRELVAAGRVTPEALAVAIGQALGLPAERIPDAERIVEAPVLAAMPMVLRTAGPNLETRIFVAPKLEELAVLERVLARPGNVRTKVRITTAREIRRRASLDTLEERSRRACLGLAADRPGQSARQVVTGAQGAVFASLAIGLAALAYHAQAWLLLLLHLGSAVFFTAPTALRLAAATTLPARRAAPARPASAAAGRPEIAHPTYSVLVALHREERVVAGLVRALAALDWPRSKLEVMLVCEADDPATIEAARAAVASEPGFEVVVVPVSQPRTKPKALNVALPLATGDFLVLYDAEDRPDPGQLEAAWRAFRSGDERLACLQAELRVGNGRATWLAGLFALEYATLFRGFLPWLAAHGLPLPLGGTSNHFRRSVLLEVGAWDSHNVTEDADLGMRLCRHGYRIGTLASPTVEDAPTTWRVWHNQRTRWMKGWLQTYLVHMRDPLGLLGDLGPKGFAAFQVLFFGMIASTFAHPVFIALLGWALWSWATEGLSNLWIGTLVAFDLVNIVGGYLAFALLAAGTLDAGERRSLLPRLIWLYPYWLLISLAAVRAFCQLWTRPHHWEKTPHEPYVQAVQRRASPRGARPDEGTAEAFDGRRQPAG